MTATHWTPSFNRLLGGEVLSALSGTAITLAVPVIAITEFSADTLTVAALAACVQSAPLLFGLSAGAVADRVDRRTALIGCNLFRAVLLALMACAYWSGKLSIWMLGLGGFALASAQLLAEATMVAAIPSIVRRSQLTWANAWFQAGGSVAQATGPAAAGLFLQWASMGPLFVAAALIHVASAVMFRRVPLRSDMAFEDRSSDHFAQIAAGVLMVWRDPLQRAIAFSSATFNFFHAAFFALFPIYALTVLNISASTLGLLISAAGIAGLGAAMAAERLVNTLSVRVTLVGSLFIVLPFSLLITFGAQAPFPVNIALIIAAFAGWDFAVVLNIVVEQSIRQATLPASHLSRASATQRFISWGVDPLGALAGGVLGMSSLGLFGALNVCMLGMGLAGVFLLLCPALKSLPKVFTDTP